MRRGEIRWATLPPPQGDRPVLLVSRDGAIERRTRVTVAPLTRRIRGLPVEVVLSRNDGVPQESAVNLDEIMTVPKATITNLITQLSDLKMAEVATAIRFAMALR
jgi:mRNA interferase MazF